MTDLLVRGARLFDPAAGLDAVGDLLIRDGRIAAVGEVAATGGEEVVEARGLWALPGLVDIHVHLREPGQEHKETVATGAAAAAAGGFTAVACEPNTIPPTDTPERVRAMQERAREAAVRVLPKCAITIGRSGARVGDLAALRAAGAVAASDDGDSVADAGVMGEAMAAAREAGMPLTVHLDSPELVARDIELAAELDWMIHISHVSLAEGVALIARARERGVRVTGEATPHHLALSAGDAPTGDADFKMNPPLRSAADREALRRALAEGVISVIASDHAPHAREEKARGYETAPPGVIGLETSLGVIWTVLVHESLLSAEGAVTAMTSGPAAVLGMKPAALAEGGLADVTLFDPETQWVVDPGRFQSKARNCPFAGWRLRGRAVATVVAGRVVMREGEIVGARIGGPRGDGSM